MALLWPDKVFWIGSFCKKAFYIQKDGPEAKNRRKNGQKPSNKGVFFPAPPTSWMSLAETGLALFQPAATVLAEFQAKSLATQFEPNSSIWQGEQENSSIT